VRLVVAIGGNALLRRGEPLDAATQRRNVVTACRAIAALSPPHELIITHGNGPQVGLLALQAAALAAVAPYPLDVLDAQSEGMIGYLLEQELMNALPGREIVTLLTQVVVDADDPAFRHPTKPIGPVYPAAEGERLAAARGWPLAADGAGWRRVVASPAPRRIVELAAIRRLVNAGVIVICVGGGGVPVTLDANGRLRGAEAVIDKDAASALLAKGLAADGLLLLTDVPALLLGWGTPTPRAILRATPEGLGAQVFDPQSMGPKVRAGIGFVAAGGRFAAIGRLEDTALVAMGAAGTRISREPPDLVLVGD